MDMGFFWDDKNVELVIGDGHTTLWIYKKTMNYILSIDNVMGCKL